MMVRAKQLFDIYWKYIEISWKPEFDGLSKQDRTAWYRMACEEARVMSENAKIWKEAVDALKAEQATMVSRKHYTDAMKSLSVCQQQIETLMVELKRWNPTSRVAQDASTVLGLLEAMIDADPDMQTDDYRDKNKQRSDEAERIRREAAVSRIWSL